MIISPCAMLMTPITPKVMARPIAASNSTLPRLIPWKRLAAMPTNRSRSPIEVSAASAAFCSSVVVPSARSAASRSSLLPETSRAAARLCCIAARISGSFSAAIAFSSNAASAAEGCLSASRAAVSRAAGSVLNRVRAPSAPSIAPRKRLLTMMRPKLSGSTPAMSSPVTASRTFVVPPSVTEMTTRPSALLESRPSLSAWRTGTARGSPSPPSAMTAFSFSAKLSPARFPTSIAKSSAFADTDTASKTNRVAASLRRRTLTRFAPLPLPHRGRGRTIASAMVGEGNTAFSDIRSILVFGLGAIAADPRIGPVGDLAFILGKIRAPGVGFDRLFGLPDDIKLAVRPDFADHDRFGQVMIGVHDLDEAARGLDLLAVHRLSDSIDISGACLPDCLRPHLEPDIMRLHRVVGHPFRVLDEVVPFLDESIVRRVLDRFEVVPGGEVADQVLRVDTGQFFLADRKRNNRDVFRLDAGIGQLFIERDVGIAIDGRDHRGLLAGRRKALDRSDLGLPVGVTKRRVVDLDVVGRHPLRLEESLEDLVGGTRIDVIGAFEDPALDRSALLAHQILDRGDRLLVRRSAGVEHVVRTLLALVSDRVIEESV